jgi:hypothetical protein
LNKNVKEHFYGPYLRLLDKQRAKIISIDPTLKNSGLQGKSPRKPLSLFVILFYYLRDLKHSVKNIFGRNLMYHIRHHYFYKMDGL